MKRGKIYEYDQERADLILAMAEIQNRAERTLPPPQTAFQDIVQHEPYPVEGKAREIIRRLKEQGLLNPSAQPGSVRFYNSLDDPAILELIRMLLELPE